MTVRIEKSGPVWTVIHSRPKARNAMHPDNVTARYDVFGAQWESMENLLHTERQDYRHA